MPAPVRNAVRNRLYRRRLAVFGDHLSFGAHCPFMSILLVLYQGYVRDTCNFSPQQVLSRKVSFLGQPIGTTFGVENQQIVRVVLPNPFRTRDQLTTDYGWNWCNL